MSKPSFRLLRIALLTLILLSAAIYSYEQKRASTSWLKPIEITIYPINIDNSKSSEKYIRSLTDNSFSAIDRFMKREGKKYDLLISQPTNTRLGAEIEQHPPQPPSPGDSILANIIWSMKFRYWAWSYTPDDQSNIRRVRMFVLYHEAKEGIRLPHSYGLNKGLLGYVNAFASKGQQGQNNIVITHEFLHTVGAADKYDRSGEPLYPIGYATPNLKPAYPQTKAEIMAGRIALSAKESRMPQKLKQCVINKITAMEIKWLGIE